MCVKFVYLRITPAWAGKRLIVRRVVLKSEDHPRVGGEKRANLVPMTPNKGSPPRGRGKETVSMDPDMTIRITPAWAGKSSRAEVSGRGQEDHPRVGGEKFSRRVCSRTASGSPPRGRGKDQH